MKQCVNEERPGGRQNSRWQRPLHPAGEMRVHPGSKGEMKHHCQKAQEKQHYRESLARRDSVRATANSQKITNMILVEEARSQGCKKCGEKRSYVLDFHHRNGEEKVETINHMIKSASSKTL